MSIPISDYKQIVHHIPISTVDLIIFNQDLTETLLFYRANPPAKHTYYTMGGRVFKNEPLLTAIRRKALEETGIVCDEIQYAGVIEEIFDNSSFEDITAHCINHYYYVVLEPSAIQLDAQHTDYKWFPVKSLHNSLIHPYVIKKVEQCHTLAVSCDPSGQSSVPTTVCSPDSPDSVISGSPAYPLMENIYGSEEIVSMIKVLLGDKLTMGDRVLQFEQAFATYIGSKYAVMVNSGSSANLLAMAVLTNEQRQIHLPKGSQCLVPAVCWSTSVFPITQMGLVPVLVDVDPHTLNIDLVDLERKITSDTKCLVAVHILGNCTDMSKLMELVKKHNLLLLEDTCESLGSMYGDRYLGTFGDMGTYSFYYSHHITTIEGGMVVCNDEADYELLKCLRAHGWTRYLKNKEELERAHPDIDPRFLFVNLGYNLRPMEIQAAMGLEQLKTLEAKNQIRIRNHDNILRTLFSTEIGRQFFTTTVHFEGVKPAWFGLCLFLHKSVAPCKKEYLEYLTVHGVENRPIVTGNMARQPIMKSLSCTDLNPSDFAGAEKIHHQGFYIGLSCREQTQDHIDGLVNILLGFFIKDNHHNDL